MNVAVDFACTAVLADAGPLLREAPGDVAAAWRAAGGQAAGLGDALLLAPGQPLHWRNYQVVEAALLDLLQREDAPLDARLRGLDWLLTEIGAHHGPAVAAPSDALAAWAREQAAADYAAALAAPGPAKLSPMRQRAVLAPFLAGLEQQWETWGRGGTGVGTRLTLAIIIIVNGVGPLPLASLEATLDQGRMRAVRFPQDDPALGHLLTRYLKGRIAAKALVQGTDLLLGWRYLLLSFAAARWYAVARATLAERPLVELDDLRHGIKIVEKGLGHAVGLREAPTRWVVRSLYRFVGAPPTMIHNFFTGGAAPPGAT